jgi:tetratricopeptide (TPR) repeat protein
MMGADIDWTLQRKAAVQTELGEYAAAKATLRRYLCLVPEDATQWVALGILCSDDEEYDLAIQCYETAAGSDPDSAWLHLNWGVTAVRAGRFEVAAQQLEELRRCAPDSARPSLLQAFIREEQNDLDGAETAYQRALDELDDTNEEDAGYVLEMAIDFFSRRQQRAVCETLVKRAYLANACTVELCEAYREATGRHHDQAMWFSLMVEADHRPGLLEVPDRDSLGDEPPVRFLRNYQVVARDRDEAVALVQEFLHAMGETTTHIREFVNDEPMEDAYTGIYEVERRCLVFRDD